MTAALWISIPLAVIFCFGVWAAIPLWMVLRHPDRKPEYALPAYLRMRIPSPAPHQDTAARRRAPADAGSR